MRVRHFARPAFPFAPINTPKTAGGVELSLSREGLCVRRRLYPCRWLQGEPAAVGTHPAYAAGPPAVRTALAQVPPTNAEASDESMALRPVPGVTVGRAARDAGARRARARVRGD